MTGDRSDFLKRVALAYGVSVLLMMLTNLSGILAMRYPDPDDALRLVQVRDLLGGQGWYDLVQHRVDPAHGGVPMHWSRLVDIPLAGTMLALRPLLGTAGAELAALLIVPMMTLLAVQLLVARIAWERLGPEAATLSCLTLLMSVPVVKQIHPLRIDHHGWQIATAMLAVSGLMTRHARAGGWLSGVGMAVGLSISLESLPLTAVFGALGAWRWLRGGETRLWLMHFVQGLAVVSLLCFAGTRGMADLANHCDAISPVQLAMFVWAALALGVLGWVRRPGMVAVAVGFAVVGAVALGIYLGAAPQCRGGSFEMLDPLVRTHWYERVDEGLPFWDQSPDVMVQTIVAPLIALWACRALIRCSIGEERVWWQEYTLLLAGAFVIALLVNRAGAVAGALACIPLAWQLGRWLMVLRQAPGVGRSLLVVAGIALAMQPALPVQAYQKLSQMTAHPPTVTAYLEPGRRHPVPPSPWDDQMTACRPGQSGAIFAALPRGTIMAPLDIGPALLLATRDSVLATGHHRGAHAMHDTIAAFLARPQAARAIVHADGVAYVAFCPGMTERQIYAHEAPDGLASQLLDGHVPGWLVPVSTPGGTALQVWKVIG